MKNKALITALVIEGILVIVLSCAIHKERKQADTFIEPAMSLADIPAPDSVLFEDWYLNVKVSFSEEFWNMGFDCGDLEEQPHYNWLVQWAFYDKWKPVTAAIYIESLYRKRLAECTDNDPSDFGCDSCFSLVFRAE